MLPVKALELMRIAALVLQPVHTLFESAEFGLLGPKLLLRFHFNSLPLLLFRRQTLEFSLAPGNFEFQLFPLFREKFPRPQRFPEIPHYASRQPPHLADV